MAEAFSSAGSCGTSQGLGPASACWLTCPSVPDFLRDKNNSSADDINHDSNSSE